MIRISLGEIANGLSFGKKGVRATWPRPSGALASVNFSGLNQYVLDALRIFSPKSEYLIERLDLETDRRAGGQQRLSAAATGRRSPSAAAARAHAAATSSSSAPGRRSELVHEVAIGMPRVEGRAVGEAADVPHDHKVLVDRPRLAGVRPAQHLLGRVDAAGCGAQKGSASGRAGASRSDVRPYARSCRRCTAPAAARAAAAASGASSRMSEVATPEIAELARLRPPRRGQQLRRRRATKRRSATQRGAVRRSTTRRAFAALLCLTTTDADADALPRRKSTLKWAQDRELLFITVPLKRGTGTRCVDEVARVVGKRRLKFETRCGDEVYELDYALANDVVAKSVTLKADSRRATALLTVKKAKRGRKWTQLVAKPEAARGLIEKDWSRWEDEEDEEDAGRRPRRRRSVAEAARGAQRCRRRATRRRRKRGGAAPPWRRCNRPARLDLARQARGDASANPRDAPALLVLASALLRNREYGEATPLLERAIKLAPSLPAHALSPPLRESGSRAFDGARATKAEARPRVAQAVAARTGDGRAYYQLGF